MRTWIRGTNAVAVSAAVIGIFIVLTLFLQSLSGFQLDLTKNKSFTLSDQTLTALKSVNKDIHITAYTNSQENLFITRQVTDILDEYKKRNSHISYDSVDMLKQPAQAKQAGVDASGTLVIESSGKTNKVNFIDMFVAGQANGSYEFSGEAKLTGAIASLLSTEKNIVYALSGHDEIPMAQMGTLKTTLEGENYQVKEINLLSEGKIPDDAQMILLLGPNKDVSDKEAKLLTDYAKGNGKLYVALGYNKDMATQWKNLDGLLGLYGVKNLHAIAVETNQNSVNDPLTIVPEYGSHPITDKLMQSNLLTAMYLNIALEASATAGDYSAASLLQTSASAYGETDLNKSQTVQDDKDVKGPLHLGYAVTDKDGKPKAVLLGVSSLLVDQEISVQGNKDFVLNSIGWLQEKKDAVSIRPRQGDAYQEAVITSSQGNTIFIGTVIVFPLLFLLTGGFVWWRRRLG
jgi:ABC-type uncharacterized transport system involved in gliding motility auxiliary subunit